MAAMDIGASAPDGLGEQIFPPTPPSSLGDRDTHVDEHTVPDVTNVHEIGVFFNRVNAGVPEHKAWEYAKPNETLVDLLMEYEQPRRDHIINAWVEACIGAGTMREDEAPRVFPPCGPPPGPQARRRLATGHRTRVPAAWRRAAAGSK